MKPESKITLEVNTILEMKIYFNCFKNFKGEMKSDFKSKFENEFKNYS